MQRFEGERAIDVRWKPMSNGFDPFPSDINCGSPPNRCTTDVCGLCLNANSCMSAFFETTEKRSLIQLIETRFLKKYF